MILQIVVEETEDNASVLTALTESHHLLQDKYLPTVNKWLEVYIYIHVHVYTTVLVILCDLHGWVYCVM